MKKAVLIALAVVTLGACGYKVEPHPELDDCWVIDKDGWTEKHEAIACNVEVKTER